jgi:hypothetical protein
MAPWTRAELEREFEAYQRRAAEAARSGDWRPWSDQFTEDAVYVEHHYGRFEGRSAIHSWISQTMGEYPGNRMPAFPIEWAVYDEERGRVVCQVWNEMEDPGDGSLHREYNITILHYAGDGMWSYEEDVYNPMRFATLVAGWEEARARAQAQTPAD